MDVDQLNREQIVLKAQLEVARGEAEFYRSVIEAVADKVGGSIREHVVTVGHRDSMLLLADAVEAKANGWKVIAEQHLRNCDYYIGLLDRIAGYFGVMASTSEDGTLHDTPVRAKLPDLVEKLVQFSKHVASEARAEGRVAESMDRLAEAAGEEKWTAGKTSIWIGGVHLLRSGCNAVVLIEIDGEWHQVITEPLDSPFSHFVEPAGIRNAPVPRKA